MMKKTFLFVICFSGLLILSSFPQTVLADAPHSQVTGTLIAPTHAYSNQEETPNEAAKIKELPKTGAKNRFSLSITGSLVVLLSGLGWHFKKKVEELDG
ncbi:MAG: LPXTG cell wall anchor domain-containing protein [Enterococcus lacertideformus]|uniref:LPXTG cell wall anchor domain-containing protein n=1 Tax=Enterococcus lacertideformus TaxID=2771493 RepID=A0A931B115_9ENTE|nr:LPXTG cell wall anchor domain-containing protein [Enterococcus lacertideformus]